MENKKIILQFVILFSLVIIFVPSIVDAADCSSNCKGAGYLGGICRAGASGCISEECIYRWHDDGGWHNCGTGVCCCYKYYASGTSCTSAKTCGTTVDGNFSCYYTQCNSSGSCSNGYTCDWCCNGKKDLGCSGGVCGTGAGTCVKGYCNAECNQNGTGCDTGYTCRLSDCTCHVEVSLCDGICNGVCSDPSCSVIEDPDCGCVDNDGICCDLSCSCANDNDCCEVTVCSDYGSADCVPNGCCWCDFPAPAHCQNCPCGEPPPPPPGTAIFTANGVAGNITVEVGETVTFNMTLGCEGGWISGAACGEEFQIYDYQNARWCYNAVWQGSYSGYYCCTGICDPGYGNCPRPYRKTFNTPGTYWFQGDFYVWSGCSCNSYTGQCYSCYYNAACTTIDYCDSHAGCPEHKCASPSQIAVIVINPPCVGQSDGAQPTGCLGTNYCCGEECVAAATDCDPECQYTGCCSGTTAVCCNSSVLTTCGTKDCDYLDTTCRDYHDVTKYCDGSGSCVEPSASQELKITVSVDFTHSLQKILTDGCPTCESSGDYWFVPINVISQSAGKIILDNLDIIYHAGRITSFSDGNPSKTIEFAAAGSDTSVKFIVPKSAVISSATVDMTGEIAVFYHDEDKSGVCANQGLSTTVTPKMICQSFGAVDCVSASGRVYICGSSSDCTICGGCSYGAGTTCSSQCTGTVVSSAKVDTLTCKFEEAFYPLSPTLDIGNDGSPEWTKVEMAECPSYTNASTSVECGIKTIPCPGGGTAFCQKYCDGNGSCGDCDPDCCLLTPLKDTPQVFPVSPIENSEFFLYNTYYDTYDCIRAYANTNDGEYTETMYVGDTCESRCLADYGSPCVSAGFASGFQSCDGLYSGTYCSSVDEGTGGAKFCCRCNPFEVENECSFIEWTGWEGTRFVKFSCSGLPAGDYTAIFKSIAGTSDDCCESGYTKDYTVVAGAVPTLSVDLKLATDSATWSDSLSGTAPLNNVDLKASVSGSAVSTINYKFDCTDDGIWDYTYIRTSSNPKQVDNACHYAAVGTYTVRVRVERDTAPPAEDTATVTVSAATACSAPTGLSCDWVDLTAMQPAWNSVSGADTYKVEFCKNGEAWGSSNCCPNYPACYSTTRATAVSIRGLESDTTYNIRVRVNQSDGSCSVPGFWSSTAQCTTAGAAAPVCSAPTGLSCDSIWQDGALMSWNSVTGATDYRLEWCESGVAWGNPSCGYLTSGNTTLSWVLGVLTPDTTYNFRIRVELLDGSCSAPGFWSSTTQCTTAAAVVCPSTCCYNSDFQVKNVTDSWPSGCYYSCQDNSACGCDSPCSPPYADCLQWCRYGCVNGVCNPCVSITGLFCNQSTSDSIELDWDYLILGATHRLEWCEQGTSWGSAGCDNIGTTHSYITAQNLESDTTYNFRIRVELSHDGTCSVPGYWSPTIQCATVNICAGQADGAQPSGCSGTNYCCGGQCVAAPTNCDPNCQYTGCCSGTTAICCNEQDTTTCGTKEETCPDGETAYCVKYCNGSGSCEDCDIVCSESQPPTAANPTIETGCIWPLARLNFTHSDIDGIDSDSISAYEVQIDDNASEADGYLLSVTDMSRLGLKDEPSSTGAGWLSGWTHRKKLKITENSGSDLTDYQVLITLNNTNFNFSLAKAGGEDFRVSVDDGETLLYHWIEEWNQALESAKIWVKLPLISANDTVVIYIYYGNSSVGSGSDGENTFLFFDDFSGNLNKWTTVAGSPSISNEYLLLDTDGEAIRSDNTYSHTWTIVGGRFKVTCNASAKFGWDNDANIGCTTNDKAVHNLESSGIYYPYLGFTSGASGGCKKVLWGQTIYYTQNTWNRWEVILTAGHAGSGNMAFKTEGYKWLKGVFWSPYHDLYVWAQRISNGNLLLDDIYVRQYASSEPTITDVDYIDYTLPIGENLPVKEIYYWRVKVRDSQGDWSDWSEGNFDLHPM